MIDKSCKSNQRSISIIKFYELIKLRNKNNYFFLQEGRLNKHRKKTNNKNDAPNDERYDGKNSYSKDYS